MFGSLQFLAQRTRPDIILAVNIRAQYSSKLTSYLFKSIKRIFGYFKLTKRFALQIILQDKSKSFTDFYCDSDFAEDQLSQKSRSGWIGYVYGFPFIWNCRKQTCTALLTPESKYIAMCEACSDIKWIRILLAELGFELIIATSLHCDNTVALQWSESADSMKKAKHIDLKYHFVEECAADEIINPEDIESDKNPADRFTKPLMKTKFERFRNLICVKPWN